MKIIDRLLNMLYPNTCCFCEQLSVKSVCDSCKEKIVYIKEPRCKKCGKPVRYQEQELCYDCIKKDHAYDQGRSLWIHQMPVNGSIYRFKYHNRRIYAEFYADELYRCFGKWMELWAIDLIVPVPLHWRRKRIRGYNQAEVVAKKLGRLSGVPVGIRAVKRTHYTRPQKELNDKERKQNLKNAFCASGEQVKNKNVLIVDDIYTTGSTIDAIATELKKKGARKVCFLTISIGQGY